ncbi:MAG: conserved repeat protein [Paenibacillaceae bacterium]|jgi:hypothetical protein|nr:conserved repeat protein [Paenibacillaceae bacterium]
MGWRRKRLWSLLLAAAMVTSLLPTAALAAGTAYVDANGNTQTAEATVINNGTTTLMSGWYVVEGNVSTVNLSVSGSVYLILADGSRLTASGAIDSPGIRVESENSLTIYGQANGSGELEAIGGLNGAGIGGRLGGSGAVTISGGTVTASGGPNGAGIGGGLFGSGGAVTISGGTVTASGGSGGAGIGGGLGGSGGTNTFTGGSIQINPFVAAAPTYDGTQPVYLTTVTLLSNTASKPVQYQVDNGTAILADTDTNGKLYLWLPVGDRSITIRDYTAATPVLYRVNGTVSTGSNGFTSGITVTAPTIVTSSLPSGTVNAAYSQSLEATGDEPVTWSIVAGSLPTGLQLSGNAISGTPAQADSFDFTVKAANEAGEATRAFTLAVGVDEAAISPASASYDLAASDDVETTITWNSARTVTGVVYDGTPLAQGTEYTVSGNQMIIRSRYLEQRNPAEGDVMPFGIQFDQGAAATFTVHVEDSYIPSANARLSGLTVNGIPVSGFDPDTMTYEEELPYDAASAAVGAIPEDARAAVSIAQAQSVPGTATVTVTAENTTTTREYTVHLTRGAAPRFSITLLREGEGSAAAHMSAAPEGEEILLSAAAASGYRFKEWQVVEGGVRITNNRFLMPDRDVTVKAVFEAIPVPAPVYAVAVQDSHAPASGAGSYAQGATVSIDAGSRSSYTFNGWSSADGVTFTNAASAATTFTMPAQMVTVTAAWTYSGPVTGGGSGDDSDDDSGEDSGDDSGDDSGGGEMAAPAPAAPGYTAEVRVMNGAGGASILKLPVKRDGNGGTAVLDAGSLPGLIPPQGTTVITVPSMPGITAYTTVLPAASLSTDGAQGQLTIATGMGSVTVPSNMLTGVPGGEGTRAEISIGAADPSGLPEQTRAAIGGRPLVQLSVAIDGRPFVWNNPDAPVTVSIPYTPTAEERLHPESLVIWYIDGSGRAVSVPNGHYDPAAGALTFEVRHFSYYAVGYNPVRFTDVAATAWYSKAVSFIAARGITTGTGEGQYSPEARLSRGEFVVLLLKACGIVPDEDGVSNFADAGDMYYTGYLAAARRLGIAEGMGGNQFAPDSPMTRQEMFTLLSKALKASGQWKEEQPALPLAAFRDAEEIAPWAREAIGQLAAAGIVKGRGGELAPAASATRAEIAQVLYNLLNQ